MITLAMMAVAISPGPWPDGIGDLYDFPPYYVAQAQYELADWAEDRAESLALVPWDLLCPGFDVEAVRRHRRQCEHARMAWAQLRAAHYCMTGTAYVGGARYHLGRLREILAPEAYARREMPDPVPEFAIGVLR